MEQMESKHGMIAKFYTEHYDELKSFVASRLQFADEVEDIVQNVYLRLLQLDQMITSNTLHSLVFTIANNMIKDYWRRKKCYDKFVHFVTTTNWCCKTQPDVSSVYSVQEVHEILERGIARLADNQSRIYRMSIFEGKRVGEIAKELNLNYKCAEQRLGAARKEMRSYMKKALAS